MNTERPSPVPQTDGLEAETRSARSGLLDTVALQQTLRQFAAERDWEPFHAPKNLAMALTVEAAELAEIFQWMDTEASRSAHADHLVQEQIGDELADVMLYLLQLADHCAVDLEQALARKLKKNALKHPPKRPGAVAAPMPRPPEPVHVLVDWENVQPRDQDLLERVSGASHAWIFHGRTQRHVDADQAAFGERLTLIPISRSGKNALDFHLALYLGYIASRNPHARIVVVSNDQGYGPMLEHARALGFDASQIGFQREGARKTSRSRTAATGAKASGRGGATAQRASRSAAAGGRAATARPARGQSAPRPDSNQEAADRRAPDEPVKRAVRTRSRSRAGTPPVADVAEAPTQEAAWSETAAPPSAPAAAAPAARRGRRGKAGTSGPPAAVHVNGSSADAGSSAPAIAAAVMASAPATTPKRPSRKRRAAVAVAVAATPYNEDEYAHVRSTLHKNRNKPTRQARLLSLVRSLLDGGKADPAKVKAVVERLAADGVLQVSDQGAVTMA